MLVWTENSSPFTAHSPLTHNLLYRYIHTPLAYAHIALQYQLYEKVYTYIYTHVVYTLNWEQQLSVLSLGMKAAVHVSSVETGRKVLSIVRV